jgi:hypothetical protein
VLVNARGRAKVIGADASGASVRPDGSSGAAPVETERLKTAWEVVLALWPELEPVMRMYYEEVPKVREHLASGTKEVEAMKEWLFNMTAASRCFSLPTGEADEYFVYFGTYNLGA